MQESFVQSHVAKVCKSPVANVLFIMFNLFAIGVYHTLVMALKTLFLFVIADLIYLLKIIDSSPQSSFDTTPALNVTTEDTLDDIVLEEVLEGQMVPATHENDSDSFLEPVEDLSQEWIDEAILDVAFNLRYYKFNSFDRRYLTLDSPNLTLGFYTGFPDPPLRSFHWEVHAFCSISFLSCLKYLKEKVDETYHQRETDISTIVHNQKWELPYNREAINRVNKECLRLTGMDLEKNKPFHGPLEKFQWQTSASYYMCWYTMQEIPNLAMFGEPCDNFANCWDAEWGIQHSDFRADDRKPYACALFSFCPDPCCPKKHSYSVEDCKNTVDSACYNQADRMCAFDRASNRNQLSIIYNHWNVSCRCPKPGYQWKSRYGMCVDVNECDTEIDVCGAASGVVTCLNLPGSYACGCTFGYGWSEPVRACIRNELLHENMDRVIKYYSNAVNASIPHTKKPVSTLDILKKVSEYLQRQGKSAVDKIVSVTRGITSRNQT